MELSIEQVRDKLPEGYKAYAREVVCNMQYYNESFSDAVKRRFTNPLARQDILEERS